MVKSLLPTQKETRKRDCRKEIPNFYFFDITFFLFYFYIEGIALSLLLKAYNRSEKCKYIY